MAALWLLCCWRPGGAVAAAILAGRSSNNDINFGGSVTVVSPTK
jgi:hypothetical protein